MKQAFLLLLSALAICSLGCANDVSVLDSDFRENSDKELANTGVTEYPTRVTEYPTRVTEYPTRVIEQPTPVITVQNTSSDGKPHHLKENTPDMITETPQPQNTEDSVQHYNRGVSHAELGEYQQAIDDYTLAITIEPGDSKIHYARGSAYAELGKYQPAIDDYTLAITIEPGDPTLHYARGFAYDELGEYQRAIDDYDQSIAINPVQAGSYINRGFAYDKLGNYQQAISDYNQAIILDPSNDAAYINRGAAYSMLQEYQQAIDNYDQAISLDPDDPMTYFNRANAFYDLREYGQAIDNYNQAISLDPDYSDAYINRGAAYSMLQEYQQAIDNYDQAISLDPDDPMRYFNRANAFYDLREYGQAIDNYNQAISLFPDYSDAYINRGAAYSMLQEYQQAIDNYDQAISLDPDDPMTYFNRANAFYDLREYGQAIDNYNQAISLDPTDMNTYYSRGRAYDGLGEHERAIADYDRTTPVDPTIVIQITPVDLGDLGETYRGVYLKHYQADGRNTYFSDSVPHALVSDLHGQIGETAQIIKTSLGADIDHQPDLYLLGDKLSFDTVERFLNVASGGFEPAGFYKTPCGSNKFTSDKCYGGVYANLTSGDGDHLWLHRLIAHEHTHSMIDSALDNRAGILASWLDEGLAQWVENEVVPHDGGEAAQNAAKTDKLLPLASLESRRDWNSRKGTDVELQYSEAHMAVSYFIEEFGGEKLFELIQNSLTSGSIDYSMRALTGISYQEFESSFFSWLNASS